MWVVLFSNHQCICCFFPRQSWRVDSRRHFANVRVFVERKLIENSPHQHPHVYTIDRIQRYHDLVRLRPRPSREARITEVLRIHSQQQQSKIFRLHDHVFFSACHVALKTFGVALLAVTSATDLLIFLGVDMGTYLFAKAVRGDLRYWLRLDGVLSWVVSFLSRIFIKILVDHTAIVQMRHPGEVGKKWWGNCKCDTAK